MGEVLLRVEDLSKTYAGAGGAALAGVSFELERGELVGLFGESGSGRSTLVRLLALLIAPTEGRIVFRGEEVTTLCAERRAALRGAFVASLLEPHGLLPEFTVLENVLLPGRIAGLEMEELHARAEELLERLGARELADRGVRGLSRGQTQCVAAARALVTRPALVVADEPTAGLHPDAAAALRELFLSASREFGTAFVVATNDRALLQCTDRLLELHEGRLEQDLRREGCFE